MEIPFDSQWKLNDEWNKNIAIIPTSIARIIGRMIWIIRATQNSTKTCFFYNSTLIVHSFGLGIIKSHNKSAVYL